MDLPSTSACPLAASGNGDSANEGLDRFDRHQMQRPLNIGKGSVARAGNAGPAYNDQARVEIDRTRSDVAEYNDDRMLRGRTQALAKCPSHDVFQNDVNALLASETPYVAAEPEIGTEHDLVCAGLLDDLGLVLGAGHRNDMS